MNTIPVKPSTFESIFFPKDHAVQVRVPDYQRAFAWEETQINLFIEDLKKYETKTGYYFGHFIVEQENQDPQDPHDLWEVVDGQQRLTTFVLFLMVCRVLAPAWSHASAFGLIERFSTVSYDMKGLKSIAQHLDAYLNKSQSFDAKNPPSDEQIRAGLRLSESFTRSQRRMVLALLRFHHAFQKKELKQDKIADYIKVVMNALCSHHLTNDKAVAVSIFEMHNTRGIPLSTIEIVKAKLMKFVYDHGGEDCQTKVEKIQTEFGEIYELEERLASLSFRGEMTMEQLLRLHLRVVDDGTKTTADAFHSPAGDANADDLIAYLETRLHFTDSKKATGKDLMDGVQYALDLAKEFKKSVRIVSQTLPNWDNDDPLVGDVLILERDLSCEFFLIVCRRLESNSDLADGRISGELLSLWEKLLFTRDFHDKYHGLWGRDDFPNLFASCKRDEEQFSNVIKGYLTNGFRPDHTKGLQSIVLKYLKDNKENILNNAFFWWKAKMIYVIYKYELSRRAKLREVMKGTISVEHILPQEWDWAWVEEEVDPSKTPSETERASLHEVVKKKVNSYLNGIGNLLLLTRGKNSAQGNIHPAKKKYDSYDVGDSYAEHNRNSECWGSSEKWPELIRARGEKIFDFMVATLIDKSANS